MTVSDADVRRARALARVLDTAVAVPGTPIRFGLDAVIGLIPGAGDVVGAALSGFIVLTAVRGGVPRQVIWRMLANVGIDTLVGTIPVLGDLFDVAFKSNIKNVELLERYAAQPAAVETKSRRLAIIVVLFLALLLVTIGAIGFFAARLIWRLLAS